MPVPFAMPCLGRFLAPQAVEGLQEVVKDKGISLRRDVPPFQPKRGTMSPR
jgi:hypothetical protein